MLILPTIDRSEWQDVVNAANEALMLDAAVQYGLLKMVDENGKEMDGSGVDVERCTKILKEGKARGIYPKELAVK